MQHVLVLARRDRAPQLHADAREQLVERERLRHVVGGAELEALELRAQVAARGEDHDRQLRPLTVQLVEHSEPVHPREEQVEDDEIPFSGARERETVRPVVGRDDSVPLRLEAAPNERLNARLVLDQQDPHRSPSRL